MNPSLENWAFCFLVISSVQLYKCNGGGLINGELLRTAAPHFDVLISGDCNMQYQQNEAVLPMSVITLVAQNNRLESFLPLVPQLLETIDKLEAKRFYQISI